MIPTQVSDQRFRTVGAGFKRLQLVLLTILFVDLGLWSSDIDESADLIQEQGSTWHTP